jgi:RsiW-degrading membrane proteinase PrsW (M82 family)
MLQTLLAVSAIVPSVLLVWYFHARDVYPEPARIIWTTFGFGVLTVLPVLLIGIPIHLGVARIEQPVLASACEALFVAAILEEFFKLTVLVLYSMRTREFDEPMDGIVYGVVASLGFATFENLLYVMDGGTGVAFSRAFSAVPLHAFLGAIMGYYVGQAWKNPGRRSAYIVRGYAIAVFLHALYDFPLMTMNALGNTGSSLPLALATLGVLVVAWRWALRLTRGLRKEQLVRRATEVATGAPEVVTQPPVRSRVIPVMQISFGVISASVGGMVALGLLLAFLLGAVAAEDTTDVLLGGAMIGLLPLAIGGLLFRYGVRGLNSRVAA